MMDNSDVVIAFASHQVLFITYVVSDSDREKGR